MYLWDPLSQYEDIFSRSRVHDHAHILTPKQWTDGSTNALNPGVILDNTGPCLLLREITIAIRGKRDGDLMNIIAKMLHRPFKLTHKYAFTTSFV